MTTTVSLLVGSWRWVGVDLLVRAGLRVAASKFSVTSILDQPATRYSLSVNGAAAYRAAKKGATLTLQAGFTQDGAPELIDLVTDGVVDYWTLKAEQPAQGAPRMSVDLQGRDAMARLLDTEYRLVYRNGPTPAVTDGSLQVPEVNGLFTAMQIAAQVCAAAGVMLFWEAPDYAVHDSFTAVGRPFDIIQSLVRPFSLLDQIKTDVFTVGGALFVRQRRPRAMAASAMTTFSMKGARTAVFTDRVHRTDPVGLLSLQGMRTDGGQTPPGDGSGGSGGTKGIVPALTWPTPDPITWPTALSGAQLNARADQPGTFAYSPSEGTSPSPGLVTLRADFTPDDPTVKSGTIKAALQVNKMGTVIVWGPVLADITEGTALGADQLNATATDSEGHPLSGSFTYKPGSGVVLPAGYHSIYVEFTPSDSSYYDKATAYATIHVLGTPPPKAPVIAWAAASPIVAGQTITEAFTTTVATASDPDTGLPVAGSFAFTPALSATPSAGWKTLAATFTPDDTATYQVVTSTLAIYVQRIIVTWAPADLLVNSPLTASQLNAQANVPGSFDYGSNPLGTVETEVGIVALLTTFTPTATGPNPVTHSAALRVIDPTAAGGGPGGDYQMRVVTIRDTAAGALGGVVAESDYWVPGNLLLREASSAWAPLPGTTGGTLVGGFAQPVLGGLVKLTDRRLRWETPIPGPTGLVNQPRQLSELKKEASCSADGQQFVYQETTNVYLYDHPAVDARGLLNTQTERTDSFTLQASAPDTSEEGEPPVDAAGNPIPGYVDLLTGASGAIVMTGMPSGLPLVPARLTVKRYRDHGPDFYSVSTETYRWNPLGGGSDATGKARGQWEFDPTASDVSISPGTRPGGLNSGGGALPVDSAGSGAGLVPQITWNDPADITWPTALGDDQLDASADVDGDFSFSPPAGTVLEPGTTTLTALFRPKDSAWKTVTATVQLRVLKIVPSITWDTPDSIPASTPLSGTQLNAAANKPGGFEYNPDVGALLTPGTHTLKATFDPDDPAHVDHGTATVSLVVTGSSSAATPVLTWDTPDAINEGVPLSVTQLNAVATDPDGGEPIPGVYVYSPPEGTVLAAGSHPLYVTFTPTDTGAFKVLSASVTLVVTKVAITWSKPSDVTVGAALDDTQLNASANVEGAFVYNPPAGTVMGSVGTYNLATTFTPAGGGTPVVKTVVLRVVEDATGGSGSSGGAGASGPYVTVQIRVDSDPTAPPLDVSDGNLDADTLGLIASQVLSVSGMWQHEIQGSGPGIPWLRRGDIARLTDLVDELGNPITVPPFLVQEIDTEYDEPGRVYRRTVRGLAWTDTP